MKTSTIWQILLVVVLAWGQIGCKSTGGSKKVKDPEGRILGIWEVKTLEQGGRVIAITEIAGETYMEFYRHEKKGENGKPQVTYKFRMEMGGNDRLFDFKLVNDSVQYQKVKGWNDMKVVELDRDNKGELLLEQAIDGNIIRWGLEYRAELTADKEKERAEAAKNAKKKKE